MLYIILRAIGFLVLRPLFRVKITGKENIPASGPLILASNHFSYFDPLIIATSMRRPVHFMGKAELFKNSFSRFFLKAIKAFPVERGKADIASFKIAVSLLKDGKVLGIFAQGTRLASADITSAKSGTAVFALKTGAVVVPINIHGEYHIFKRIRIAFGAPLYFDKPQTGKLKREQIDHATEKIIEAMNKTNKTFLEY